MQVNYLPYAKRAPDFQYLGLLKQLMRDGIRSETQQSSKKDGAGKETFSLPYPVTHVYDLRNGFPWETGRSMKSGFIAVNELFAFVNGVRSNDVLVREWGVPFWNSTFEDPEKCRKRGLAPGDLGPASYAVLGKFPTKDGSFNQMQALVEQIRELPHLKTHIATTLYPPGIFRGTGKVQKVVTVPCHGTIIYVTVLERKMNLTMVQRSADVLVGEPHDRVAYPALLLALAHVTGYEPGIFSVVYLNPHFYENQRAHLEEFVARKPVAYPTVTLANPPDDIFAFRRGHFELADYHPHPAMPGIPVSP